LTSIDNLRYIDERRYERSTEMILAGILRRDADTARLCDSACVASAVKEQALTRAQLSGRPLA
jgi:hypothetical protein